MSAKFQATNIHAQGSNAANQDMDPRIHDWHVANQPLDSRIEVRDAANQAFAARFPVWVVGNQPWDGEKESWERPINSILELIGRRESGTCPDSLPLHQALTCMMREPASHGGQER